MELVSYRGFRYRDPALLLWVLHTIVIYSFIYEVLLLFRLNLVAYWWLH
jgi:hypothetical protein